MKINKQKLLTSKEEVLNYVNTLPISKENDGGSKNTLSSLSKLHLMTEHKDNDELWIYGCQQYNNLKCVPKWTIDELCHKMDDCYKQGEEIDLDKPKRPINLKEEKVIIVEPDFKHLDTDIPEIYDIKYIMADYTAQEFVNNCFSKTDTILICYPEVKRPEQIQKYTTEINLSGSYGVWIGTNSTVENPLNDKGYLSLSKDTVNQYKYALVDFDSNSKVIQYNLLKHIKLPCSAIIESGDRGYHAWVAVNATTPEEFKEKTDRLQKILDHFCIPNSIKLDAQVTSRYAGWGRLGGAMRGENKQRCIFLDKNPKNFEQWYTEMLIPHYEKLINSELLFQSNEIVDASVEPIIGKYIKNQSILSICSQTGLGKSVLATQWAVCLSLGLSLMDFDFLKPIRPLKVLTLQAEDDMEKIRQVVTSTVNELKLTKEQQIQSQKNLIFTKPFAFTSMTSFFKTLTDYCNQIEPNVVFINPLNRYFQGDFCSDHEKIAGFVNQLDTIAKSFNCVICIITHTAKPSEEKRTYVQSILDDSYAIFGSSLWASALRNIILLEQTADERKRCLKFGKGFEDLLDNRRKLLAMSNPPLKVFTFVEDVSGDRVENSISNILNVIPTDELGISKDDIVVKTKLGDKSVRDYLKTLTGRNEIMWKFALDGRTKMYYRIKKINQFELEDK